MNYIWVVVEQNNSVECTIVLQWIWGSTWALLSESIILNLTADCMSTTSTLLLRTLSTHFVYCVFLVRIYWSLRTSSTPFYISSMHFCILRTFSMHFSVLRTLSTHFSRPFLVYKAASQLLPFTYYRLRLVEGSTCWVEVKLRQYPCQSISHVTRLSL